MKRLKYRNSHGNIYPLCMYTVGCRKLRTWKWHTQAYTARLGEYKQESVNPSYGVFKLWDAFMYRWGSVCVWFKCKWNVVSKRIWKSFYLYKSFLCRCSYEKKRYQWCVCGSVILWACQQVKFSSFPPHLPQAHRPLLSQSVSSETTFVSSSSLRAELSDERKLIAEKCTPACIRTQTHT